MFEPQDEMGGSAIAGIRDHFAQAQPNLGYGKQSEARIDQVNQWMRSTPWYQEQMRAWGQDPGHPTLTKQQSAQILRMAQANGVVVDQGDMEIDNHGNFNPRGHKLRNTLIVAGAAAAALTAGAALGAFGGGAGAGGGAAASTVPAAGTAAGGMAGVGGITASPGLAGSLSAGSMIGGGATTALPNLAAGVGGMTAAPGLAGTLSEGSMIGGGAAASSIGKNIARTIGTTAADVAGSSFKKQLASALAALGGAGVGRMLGGGGSQSSVPPELQQLLQMSIKHQQDLDPLRQNVTRGVNAMLPTFARGE